MADSSKIAIVIHSLTGGGSEHAAAMMASHWAAEGHAVTIITLDKKYNDTIALHKDVHRIGLNRVAESTGIIAAIFNNVPRICALRQVLDDIRPTRVISLTDRMNVLTILGCRGVAPKPIVAERTDPRYHRIGGIWNILRRWTYPRAKAIVVQTEAVREHVQSFAKRCPVLVIPNAVSIDDEAEGKPAFQLDQNCKWICAVGRLSTEKGFDRLIGGFALIAEKCPDWNLAIVGDGPSRKELELQIAGFGLTDRIQLTGWVEKPWPSLSNADVFVLPSRYEGFPNALLEAMARGKACVAVECPSGPGEIIRQGENGLLVDGGNDEEVEAEIGEALYKLLGSEGLRESFGENAKSVLDVYSVERHFAAWDAIEG